MHPLFVKRKARSSARVRDQRVREEYGAMGFFRSLIAIPTAGHSFRSYPGSVR